MERGDSRGSGSREITKHATTYLLQETQEENTQSGETKQMRRRSGGCGRCSV